MDNDPSAKIDLTAGDALILVDVQNDFLPGGSLAVPAGNEIIPVLNRYIALFHAHALPIFATRDWHPRDHCSFDRQGGPWPPHCIASPRTNVTYPYRSASFTVLRTQYSEAMPPMNTRAAPTDRNKALSGVSSKPE